jgi:hypothetical protein
MRLARLPVLASGEVLRKPLGDDLAGVAKLTAAFKRLNAAEETASFESRYLFLQLSLDESAVKYWGQTFGQNGQMTSQKQSHQRSKHLCGNDQEACTIDGCNSHYR